MLSHNNHVDLKSRVIWRIRACVFRTYEGGFSGAVVTSEIVGSILATPTDSCETDCQRSAESHGFSSGAQVSSHRES
jgi:hypothetical protein